MWINYTIWIEHLGWMIKLGGVHSVYNESDKKLYYLAETQDRLALFNTESDAREKYEKWKS